ncbi:hypothetical protein NDU88_002562 [Pleurodeles waltl]|uniref:Uncharacterized protein n=1 Tax=Pleurodeles waltl TaxID=8319 RepID=A0AAV7VZP7_PLEWA|nr:hypothetical protein NDU88_002562 [Pleurodeles waltl]
MLLPAGRAARLPLPHFAGLRGAPPRPTSRGGGERARGLLQPLLPPGRVQLGRAARSGRTKDGVRGSQRRVLGGLVLAEAGVFPSRAGVPGPSAGVRSSCRSLRAVQGAGDATAGSSGESLLCLGRGRRRSPREAGAGRGPPRACQMPRPRLGHWPGPKLLGKHDYY